MGEGYIYSDSISVYDSGGDCIHGNVCDICKNLYQLIKTNCEKIVHDYN